MKEASPAAMGGGLWQRRRRCHMLKKGAHASRDPVRRMIDEASASVSSLNAGGADSSNRWAAYDIVGSCWV